MSDPTPPQEEPDEQSTADPADPPELAAPSGPGGEPDPAAGDIAPPRSPFNAFNTAVFTFFVALAIAGLAAMIQGSDPAEFLEYPVPTAIAAVDTAFDDLEHLSEASPAERWMLGEPFFDADQQRRELIEEADGIYRSVGSLLIFFDPDFDRQPADEARLHAHHAVLLAEAGRWEDCADALLMAQIENDPRATVFARALREAYPQLRSAEIDPDFTGEGDEATGATPTTGPTGERPVSPRERLGILEDGWSKTKLLRRITGDPAIKNPRSSYGYVMGMSAATLGVIFAGVFTLLVMVRNGLPAPPENPPLRQWLRETRAGYPIMVRAAFYGVLVVVVAGALYIPGAGAAHTLLTLVAGIPLLLLLRRHLLEGGRLGPGRFFPLRVEGGPSRLAGLVLAVTAIDWIGALVVSTGARAAGLRVPLLEGIADLLIFAPWAERAGSAVDMVVFAPFFEELFFRGLLFPTLRTRFSFGTSALVSATVFSAVHGYSPEGFFIILWGGLVYAWVYERTGSLLPCMLCHSLHNLFALAWTLRYL